MFYWALVQTVFLTSGRVQKWLEATFHSTHLFLPGSVSLMTVPFLCSLPACQLLKMGLMSDYFFLAVVISINLTHDGCLGNLFQIYSVFLLLLNKL